MYAVYMGHKINNIRLVLCVWRVCFYFGNIEPHPSTVSDRYDNSPTRRTTSWLEEIRKYNGGGGEFQRTREVIWQKKSPSYYPSGIWFCEMSSQLVYHLQRGRIIGEKRSTGDTKK